MDFLGVSLGSEALLAALCVSYLLVLTAQSLIKYSANVVRGRVNERIVRRIRLCVVRRRRAERSLQTRSTLAAIAIQECEPIGYFGGSLFVVPLIYGGTLLTSLVFLFVQDVALAFAAVMMLPVQVAVLPRLQQRVNAKVRERVQITRSFNASLSHEVDDSQRASDDVSHMRHHMRQAETLECVRLEINELKSRLKSLYNYTSNLTPFFLFSIGGYLVLQERLSLGALVAALAAYREISPALRELFDFVQNWSDARAVRRGCGGAQTSGAGTGERRSETDALRLVSTGGGPRPANGRLRQEIPAWSRTSPNLSIAGAGELQPSVPETKSYFGCKDDLTAG